MANQPTKYRKFVVGAASAALVASAVAPVASAKDFSDTKGNTHEAAIDALSDAGIISGYQDGSFKPNQTLTRSDVVKLMGKWLVSVGYEVPADYKTNMRFSDLTASTNDELLKYAAVVKDNGVFNGSNGRLLAGDDITRENMAVVLVRAFDTVEDIDLVEYVSAQDFNKDVTDRNSAKAEARTAIDVLDFFDITTVAQFNPKATTTRGHFATFLNNFLKADLSNVTGTVSGVAAVKAVNATTVEVAFTEKVENVNSLNFTIEGLTVSNAAVKQSDDKVVVLTTSNQEGGKKYTVAVDGKELGSFEGISAVVPTKIDITTQSVQGKVGAQAIVSADVGVKQAGIPVTFNVKANTINTLNKDQVFEALTDENGIATFSYTQYAAGNDQVIAYPTGAPAVRDLGYVFWGVDTILSVKANDEKGTTLKNGENKIYTVTYLDPRTGKPLSNEKLNVTFAENLDTTINKTTDATINGANPLQLTNGKVDAVTVTTNGKGEATFTVSGSNTKATPIVFVDGSDSSKVNSRLEASELQAKADELTFGATQADYKIEVTRNGGEEAATGTSNGRSYKVVVTDKDGKVAPNEWVQVAFDEDIDRVISTKTQAYFVDANGKEVEDPRTKAYSVKTNSKGEATFKIASKSKDDYATPVVWLDVNSSNAQEGKLDEGEPFKVADITYFATPKLTSGVLQAYLGTTVVEEDEEFKGTDTAKFEYKAANQSGKEMELDSNYYTGLEVSYTVFNTGDNDVTVFDAAGNELATVSPNRSYTVPGTASSINVKPDGDKTASVRVEATGTAIGKTNVQNVYLGNKVVTATFKSTKAVGDVYTGVVTFIDTKNQKITFSGKDSASYAKATFYNEAGVAIDRDEFEKTISANLGDVKVTLKKDGDKTTASIIKVGVPADEQLIPITISAAEAFDTDADGKADTVELTFSSAITDSKLTASSIKVDNGTVASVSTGTTANDDKVVIKVTGATDLNLGKLTVSGISSLGAKGQSFAEDTITLATATVDTLAVATKAVENAEASRTQADVTTAQTEVNKLAASPEKAALQFRIDTVQAELDQATSKTALSDAVTAAQQKHNAAVEGTATGEYPAPAKANYQSAINAAKAVLDNASSTKAQLDQAALDLATATSTFEGAVTASEQEIALGNAEAAYTNFITANLEGTLDWDTLITAIHFLQVARDADADVSTLESQYAAITTLDMGNVNTSDYAISTGAFVDFTGLTSLDLSNTGITELGGLVNLTSLEELNISGNGITDLNALVNLANLTNLNASNNPLAINNGASPISALVLIADPMTFDASGKAWNLGGITIQDSEGLVQSHVNHLRNVFTNDSNAGGFTAPTVNP